MLRIFLFGRFRVEVDGVLIEETAWPRRKVKNLLKLLALQTGYRIHKDQALDLLWPDLDIEAASGNLYRLLHLLRRTLETGTPNKTEASYVLLKEEIIRLNTAKGIWVDLEAFQNLLKRARTEPDPAPTLEEAIELYQGDVLEEDPYEEWTLLSREENKRYFIQTLLTLASLHRQRKHYPAAIAALQRILAKEATNETAHRELIFVYTLAGQRSEALNQYQLCTEIISNELGLDLSPETLEMYQQVLAGTIKADLESTTPVFQNTAPPVGPAETNKLSSPDTASTSILPEPVYFYNNLPAPLTPLVGRGETLAKAVELLETEGRLVTLSGPGGVGKTRLALEIGQVLLAKNSFAQGLCFVSLASLKDPNLVPLAIAEVAGIKEANGLPPLVFLKNKLRESELLLVLDNFEQVIEASEVLSELLSSCRKLKMLVTSRTVLHLYGEQELLIEPLELPPSRSLLPLELLQQSPAVTFFTKRAQAAKADFKLTQENARAVSEICFRLDGLPLAIELAAPQVKLFSPQLILSRMTNWYSLLNAQTRNISTRQHTMQNVLDWSYDLLDEAEQNLLAQLGVFVQSCTVEAVEAICPFDSNRHFFRKVKAKLQHTSHILEHLSGLVDKSLLYRQEVAVPSLQITGDVTNMVRFRMLEIIREYALEQLKARGEEEMLRENHLNYYLELVEEVEPQLHRFSMGPLLKQLELEHDNLRAALRWSLDDNREDPDRIEKGIRLVAALTWFWHFRGYWSEGSVWVEKALELAGQGQVSKVVRAKIWHAAGILNASQGQVTQAFAQLEEGLKLFRELDDKWGIAHSYDWTAELHRSLGNYSEARPFYEAAHELCLELKDTFCANLEQIGLGYICFQQGDYKSAQTFLKNGLETSRGLRDKFGSGSALNGLGELFRRQGDYQHALDYYKQSLSLFRDMGLTGKVVLILHNIGQLELDRENFNGAEGFFKSSLVLSYEIKSKRMIAWCLGGLACAACGQGRLEEAARLFGATEALLNAMNSRLDPSNQTEYNRSLLVFHDLMPDPLGEAALEEGATLPLEQVISAVLNKGVFSFDP